MSLPTKEDLLNSATQARGVAAELLSRAQRNREIAARDFCTKTDSAALNAFAERLEAEAAVELLAAAKLAQWAKEMA